MKITSTSLIFCLNSFLSFSQWTNGGIISEKFGNSSNGLLTTQWKSIGIGDFQASLQTPKSRLHIDEFLLPPPSY